MSEAQPFSDDKVLEIRHKYYREQLSYCTLAKEYDTYDQVIGKIMRGDPPYEDCPGPTRPPQTRITSVQDLPDYVYSFVESVSVHKDPGPRFTRDSLYIRGIYFLWRGEEIVYIGMSRKNIYRRIFRHADKAWEWDSFCYIVPPEEANNAAVKALERWLIQWFNPEYNKQHSFKEAC